MRSHGVWLGMALSLLLCACAGMSAHPGRAALTPPQARDCDALFPHQEAGAVVDVSTGILPAGLADAGTRSLALSRFYKCREDNLTDRNKYLVALSEDLRAEQRQLQADIDTYKQRLVTAQAESDDYNATCHAEGLDAAQYQACVKRQQQVNQDIAETSALYPDLQRRKESVNAKVMAYDQDISALPGNIQAAYHDYQAAIRDQSRWLDVTRNLMVVPANQATVAGAACPAVQPAASTVPELDAMTEALVACLRRMPATLLLPAPRVESASSIAALAGAHGLDAPSGGGI